MPGLIIDGKEVLVPGLDIKNWNDDPRLRRSAEDGKARKTTWVRQVILHTTGGIPGGSDLRPQVLKPGAGPNLNKEVDVANFWSTSKLQSGAHIVIDVDGSIGCLADLAKESMFHAGIVNDRSIGIEMYQMHVDAGVYQATIDAAVKLCNALSEIFGIQRQIHYPYLKGPVSRLEKGGDDCVGFFGHRDVTNNRGQGDPGDFIMQALLDSGYEKFNFQAGEDLIAWKERQNWLNSVGQSLPVEGVPGPLTYKALQDAGVLKGLWVLGVLQEEPVPEEVKVPENTGVSEALPSNLDRADEIDLTEEEKLQLRKLLTFLRTL